MDNREKFIIITRDDLQSHGKYIAGASGVASKDAIFVESDCACPTDDLILLSDPQNTERPPWFEDDCACPTDDISFERLSTDVDKVIQYALPPLHIDRLTEDFSLVFNPSGKAGVVTLNHLSMALLQAFEKPTTLAEGTASIGNQSDALSAAVRLIHLNLIQPVGSNFQLTRSSPKTLTVWLHLTNECNLRCDYCYLHKTHEYMSLERGKQAVDAVYRSAIAQSFRQVKLKFAGGESTLEFNLILQLHDYALEQANKLGLGLISVVLSNGIGISDQMIESLRERNIRLSISLDGIGEYNDSQRKFQNGRGSFALIERSLDRLTRRNFKPSITITVSHRNSEGLPQIVEYLLKRGLPFTINFYRENEHSASFKDLVYQDEKMIVAMQAAFAKIENNLPPFSLLGAITDRARLDAPHSQPCGVGHSYMVIDQNGNVAKCHMEIERKITDISVADPLRALQLDVIGIQNLPVEEKEGCRTCEWRHYCAGGCPALTYRVTGRYDVKSPNCRIYKALFPEVLRLEGLRLLQYANRLPM
jgi:uncharacterized protein